MKKAERELGKVLRREKRKMKEVDSKAYQAGYDRARAEYMRDARKMVNEEIEFSVPVAYRTGYKDGVKAACRVLQLEADLNLTKSILAPVTPELVLPYTEEECTPLPLRNSLRVKRILKIFQMPRMGVDMARKRWLVMLEVRTLPRTQRRRWTLIQMPRLVLSFNKLEMSEREVLAGANSRAVGYC